MIQEKITTLTFPYPGKRTKKVRVFVPAHEAGEKLPVIYMPDGQNLFDVESSGFGCWYTREAIREEFKATGNAAIIVGIHNDEGDVIRTNDLGPASIGRIVYPPHLPESERTLYEPLGERFADFVIHTVMPAIEAQFPVKTGRENTAFCGSSMGGLMTFFITLSHPDLFCAGGALSPALLLYEPEDLKSWIEERSKGGVPFLYMYSGDGDELEKMICVSTEYACDIMEKCYPKSLFKKVITPGEPHHERAWEPIFRDFLHIFLSE